MPRRPYSAEGTVETIVDNGLCTQCGFCEPVCPTRAITLAEHVASGEILPRVDPAACIMCPLCLAVCPGETVDFDHYQRTRLEAPDYHKYYGYIDRAYLAWATDAAHRHRAASGGVATRLAAYALESGTLDYLMFARPRADDPFRTETVLARDAAELEGAHGSFYFPVPLGEGMRLLEERAVPRDAKLGIVGLPCHIHGALKTLEAGKFRRWRWTLVFGVFCGGTWTYRALDAYLATKGVARRDVTAFTFRGGGWPGRIRFTTRDGRTVSEARHNPALVERIDKASIFSANSFFTPHRCLTCSDGMADLADIAFGDPWLKSERQDTEGKTLVLTRSERGARLVAEAVAAGVIATRDLDPALAVASQKGMLTFKQNYLAFNRIVGLLTGRRTPRYNYRWSAHERVPPVIHVYTAIAYVNHLIGRHLNHRWLRLPLSVLQGAVARVVKRRFVRLTPQDDENYFA